MNKILEYLEENKVTFNANLNKLHKTAYPFDFIGLLIENESFYCILAIRDVDIHLLHENNPGVNWDLINVDDYPRFDGHGNLSWGIDINIDSNLIEKALTPK